MDGGIDNSRGKYPARADGLAGLSRSEGGGKGEEVQRPFPDLLRSFASDRLGADHMAANGQERSVQ